MTKTIEDAAKRFADMKTVKQAGSSVERDKKALLMTQFFHFALEELPLSSRLTAEEKEQIKKLYCAAEASKSDYSRGYSDAIKRIFGSDFFKED